MTPTAAISAAVSRSDTGSMLAARPPPLLRPLVSAAPASHRIGSPMMRASTNAETGGALAPPVLVRLEMAAERAIGVS